MVDSERILRAWQLRTAIVAMTTRYGQSCRQEATAAYGTDQQRRLGRAQQRQFAAMQRLAGALCDFAADGFK